MSQLQYAAKVLFLGFSPTFQRQMTNKSYNFHWIRNLLPLLKQLLKLIILKKHSIKIYVPYGFLLLV